MELGNVQTDDSKDFGITFAREAYNAGLPQVIAGPVGENGMSTLIPNPALSPSDSHYLLMRIGGLVDSYAAQATAAGAAPAPMQPPSTVNGVPQKVTKRQGRQALIQVGKIGLVQPAIDAIVDPVQRAMMQSEWDDSQSFERQRPSLIGMATSIGLTSIDLDNLFKLADTL